MSTGSDRGADEATGPYGAGAPPGVVPAVIPDRPAGRDGTSGIARRPGGVAIGIRWATLPAGGALMGVPRPRRDAADRSGPAGEVDAGAATDGVDADAGAPTDSAEVADGEGPAVAGGIAAPSGAPRPAGGVPALGLSAQRLTVRAGGVGRGAEPLDPGAEADGALPVAPGPVPVLVGRMLGADVDDAGEPADEDRCTAPAVVAGAVVSGREEGVTVAAGGTVGSDRTGVSGSGSDQAPAASGAGSAAAAAAARRWTGRVGIGVLAVRLGTAASRATTRPAGAAGPVSWPSGVTIGGRGWWPGTASRNAAAGATTGGAPVVRWMGGSRAHAPVGAARPGPELAGATEPGADVAGPSGAASEGLSDGVRRPNGHGRRTGVTPPLTGAC
ncbi:MAG TPA: hypothetical protein VES19_08055 [Candidatus Limnocylindrales bacterium]|nr:hypothetical protein [Candidatus Limnocylindrales bacterium]